MKSSKRKHGIVYNIARFAFLGCYLAAMVVLIVEAATPSKESARKSDATGIAISNIINDLNGDTAIEILPEECNIIIPKLEYNVGQNTSIKVETLPEEATYKSYTYSSSDPSVATISEVGEISCLKAGTTEIKAVNTKVPSVFSTVTITVKNIELESFTSKINASLEGGVYQLEIGSSYLVTNTFKPSNATFKDVTYEYDDSLGYISMEYDTITAINSSEGATFDLIVHCGELSNTLKLKTLKKEPVIEDYPLVGFKANNVTKYIDQTSEFTPSISYNPTYVSSQYKGYTLSSGNTDVVTVNGLKLKPKGVIGTAKITITSTYDPSITGSFNVNVVDRPTLQSISINRYSSTMYVGKTQTISVSTNPSSNLSITKSFSSSNTSAATVTNSGVVTGKAVGSTTITATVKDTVHNVTKTASVNISIIEAPVYTVTDIEIGYKHGENPNVYADNQINLKDYFYIKTYVGNANPTNKDYSFYIDTDQYPGSFEDGIKYTPSLNGEVVAYLNYINETDTTISKEIKFTVLSQFNVTDENGDITSSENLYVKERKQFSVVTTGSYGQVYRVTNNNSEVIDLSFDGTNISIYVKKSGSASFTVTPVLLINEEEMEYASASKTISITTNEKYTTTLGLQFLDSDNNVVEFTDEDTITLYMKKTIKFKALLDDSTTLSYVTVKSSSEILTIKNNTLIPNAIGDAIISVKEQYSDLSKLYKVKIRNLVTIDEKKAFVISGFYNYDVETNTLTIVNGDSVTVRYNFDSSSTYRTVDYHIEDENIATIGTDGMITPVKVGETILTMTVQDEMSIHATASINIKIIRKDFIENMHDFLLAVRKAIGHFGAFAVLGIFATITYFMFFRKDMFPFGLGINITTGYFFAVLTEEIQRHTPGRNATMSDVVIDFRGYILSVVVITTIIIIVALIKLLVRFIKKKKNPSPQKD